MDRTRRGAPGQQRLRHLRAEPRQRAPAEAHRLGAAVPPEKEASKLKLNPLLVFSDTIIHLWFTG